MELVAANMEISLLVATENNCNTTTLKLEQNTSDQNQ